SISTKNNKNSISQILMTSMAVSDAFVGVLVMPLAVVETINNGAWTLGEHWCTARVVIGVILCAVSIYHVMCMAVDRYFAVCKPFLYRRMSSTAGHVMAALCWVIPTILILLNHVIGWQSLGVAVGVECEGPNNFCLNVYNETAFCVNILLYFFIPFAAIFILYCRVLREIFMFNQRKSKRLELERQVAEDTSPKGSLSAKYFKSARQNTISKTFAFIREIFHKGSFSPTTPNNNGERTSITIISFKMNDTLPDLGHKMTSPRQCSEVESFQNINNSTRAFKCMPGNDITKLRNGNPNVKAFRTIGFVVACFTVCWLPFCLSSAIITFSGVAMPAWLRMGVSWLGYINSTINPFLFCCNRSVRRSVRQLSSVCVR
ncbi:unnamed protein product, partial [Lymnaea stagnalis]